MVNNHLGQTYPDPENIIPEPEMAKIPPVEVNTGFGSRKHIIYGDVGGHYDPFVASLTEQGVDCEEYTIPANVIIVQVGDLVHKGPDSEKIVDMVNIFTKMYPDQWIQLAGNHELPYVTNQVKFYPDEIPHRSAEILRSMKEEKRLRVAYSFTDSTGRDYLLTHAGLTQPNYDELCSLSNVTELSAKETSQLLNNHNWNNLLTAGAILYGHSNIRAGVFWADCISELYFSWLTPQNIAPFDQIHGHTNTRQWERGGLMHFSYPSWLRDNLKSDFENMHTVFSLYFPSSKQKMNFYAIDPALGRVSFLDKLHPLIVE